MRLETTVADFYTNNGPAKFIDKIAAFLKIETANLKIVSIRSGSAIVDFFIDSNKTNDTTSEAVARNDLK